MTTIHKIPASAGTYTLREAALYLKATFAGSHSFPTLHTQHLSWWFHKGLGSGDGEGKTGGSRSINFLELVSFRMVAAMRAHGVSRHDIELANSLLREKWGWDYPFAMQQIWIVSPDLFVEIDGAPVAVTRFWQSALDLMRGYLVPVTSNTHGLSFDDCQLAATWSPSEGVLIDPLLQFGEPCIAGTRIPTETIWALSEAGDDIELIARVYGLPVSQIKAAVKWESRLAEIAAN